MRRLVIAAVPVFLSLLACSGDFVKSCTAKVVGETVETTKEVTSGVAEGIEEGRKSGTSIDGAHLVSSMAELEAVGGLGVAAVEEIDASNARVVMAVENRGDQPLRVTGLEVAVLDDQGFVQRPSSDVPSEITVPPRAKERVSFDVPIPASKVGTVRAWSTDLRVP